MPIKKLISVISLFASVSLLHAESLVPKEVIPGPDDDHYTVIRHLDMDMVKRNRNFGYTDEEIQKYFSYPQRYEYDTTGMAKGLVKPPPAPGIHPRVLFYPEDVPALRKKLTETTPGQLIMTAIRKTVAELITGPNAKYGQLYKDAIDGKQTPGMDGIEPACAIEYESFRCLIDNDAEAAKKNAAALSTLAAAEITDMDAGFAEEDKANAAHALAKPDDMPLGKPFRSYGGVKTKTQAGLLGLAYDFIYNWMSDAQRDTVRLAISKASANMSSIGQEALPALPAGTSNWIPMHMRLALMTTAIEGEPGYDPTTLERCSAGYRNYLGSGFFPAGEMYESMAKNFVCTENLVPIANRGDNLLALRKLRDQVTHYYLAAMDPWGGHFTFYDSLGGRGNSTPMFDVMVLKHYFPNDPAIDFVYRNQVGEDYGGFGGAVRFGHPFYLNDGIIKAIFGEEFNPGSWDESFKAATTGKPLTYFSPDTGNLITRSAWTKEALQFYFLTRCVAGGHLYSDRGHFSLYALGRYWAIYKPLRQVPEHYNAKHRSVILVDNQGPGMATAKCVDMQDSPQATFIATDTKSAYNFTPGHKGALPVPFTGNDFRLTKSPYPWMDLPWSDLPNWMDSKKGSVKWVPYNTMDRVFRTGGLVRGKHPYCLIVDDIQKDAKPHHFEWGMALEDDVVAISTTAMEAVLGEEHPGPKGRFLLVRLLSADGLPASPINFEKYDLANPPQRALTMKRLNIQADAVAPDFKTLLFPYREGEEQPLTTWDTGKTKLSITWKDQKDVIEFMKGSDGRTRLNITRDGVVLTSLK